MALEDQYFFNCFECGKEDFQGSILDFHRHLSTHQSSEENSQKNDFDSDQMPPMVLDGKGNRYLDMGTYLLKIEPTTSKRSAEDDLPQQNVPKKKKIVKSSVKEDSNGNGRRILDSSKFRSCPYCDKEMKKSRLPHHINHQHDQTCPKCPTVVGLKANEFLRHWKSPEHYAKIGYNCKDCMFATQNLKKFRFHRLKCHGSQLKNCDHAKMLAKAEEFEQVEKPLRYCPFVPCSFSDYDFWNLKVHVHTYHDHRCPHCVYESEDDIQRHMSLEHNEKEKPMYFCGKCKISTCDPMKFWKHRQSQHGDLIYKTPLVTHEQKMTEHQCIYCNAKRKNLFQMFIHIHENHDPSCSQCHWISREDNEGMARHMESFGHTWYEISKVKCSAWGCEKKFQNFQEYWQHRYSTHGDDLYNIKDKKFMTDYR